MNNKNGNSWINVEDKLPELGMEVLVAYIPKMDIDDKVSEYSFCTAYYEDGWKVKDQLFYKKRTCIVYFWQSIPQLP